MNPKGFKYTHTHEWVSVKDNLATIGITDHAQSELGDIIYVELPTVESHITKGIPLGTLESVKTVSDIIAPVSGEVVEINKDLPDNPETINDNPYESGWMAVVKMDDVSELNDLMNADEYESFIQES